MEASHIGARAQVGYFCERQRATIKTLFSVTDLDEQTNIVHLLRTQ